MEDCRAMAGDCCYLCNECSNSYPSLDQLERHMGESHADTKKTQDVDEARVSCLLGGRESRQEMETGGDSPSSSDVSLFPEETPDDEAGDLKPGYACRFCPVVFDDRSQLNIHYTHTHRDKPQYECEVCHTVFAVKRELSTHMRIHSGETPHKCTQCGKEFGTRQLLKKHWMWHTGERSHVCPHCQKAFFQKGHLTQHLMIHAGGRPHECKLCQKTFIFKFDLNRHMKIHAERGFSCAKCGRSFLKQLSLDEHTLKCKGTASATRTSSPQSSETTTESPRRLSTPAYSMVQQPLLNFSQDDMMAQTLVAQQQQRALVSALTQQQAAVQQGLLQQFYCIFCAKHFPNQAAFAIHLSFVHFNNAVLSPPTLKEEEAPSNAQQTFLPPVIKTEEPTEEVHVHSDTATNSSCASSPQKASPATASQASPSADSEQSGGESPVSESSKCGVCERERRRAEDSERALAVKSGELEKARDAMRRVSTIAAQLLDSCNDFDKIWAVHSKKVYAQIQAVLYSVE